MNGTHFIATLGNNSELQYMFFLPTIDTHIESTIAFGTAPKSFKLILTFQLKFQNNSP